MMNGMFGGMWFGWIFGVVILAVIIWAVVRLNGNNRAGMNSSDYETPLDILKKRYARGEISKEQFEEMKRNL